MTAYTPRTPPVPLPATAARGPVAPRPTPRTTPLAAPPPPVSDHLEPSSRWRSFSLSPGPGNPWPLFSASLGAILHARKTPFLLLWLLIPVFITLIISGSVGMDHYTYNQSWGGAPSGASPGLLWFQDASYGILFPFLIPVVVAVFATGAIGEEVEAKTLPYLFTRPIYRNWVLLAKISATYLGLWLMVDVALTVFWFVAVGLTENPLDHAGQLFGYSLVAALTILATGGVFLLLGVLMRRAIILISLYLFVWEFGLTNAPIAAFQALSFVHFERAILVEVTGRALSRTDLRLGTTTPSTAFAVLAFLAVAGLAASFYVVSNKDYNV